MAITIEHLLPDDVAQFDGTRDRLSQGPVLDTLAAATRALPTPCCVALYGAWGTGKTTLLNALYEAVPDGQKIWFDPWHYEGREDLLTPLLQTIMRAGSTSEVKRLQMKRWGGALLKTAVSIGARVGAAAIFGPAGPFLTGAAEVALPGAGRMDVGPQVWEDFEAALRSQHDAVRALPATFGRLVDAMLEGAGEDARVYIFLDDLDRCLPDNAVRLIEAIKLLLCGAAQRRAPDGERLARAVFVFGLDRKLVGEASRARYPQSTLYSGETYLEKIFDLSLEVPPVRSESVKAFIVGQWIRLGIEPTSLEDLFHEVLLTRVLGDPVFANPRVIKRTLNRLALLHAHEEARQVVQHLKDHPEQSERLLWWIAGAERYRAFRQFFATSSDEECERLGQAVAAIGRGERPQLGDLARLRGFLDDPGFVRYYSKLVPAWSLSEQRRSTNTKPPATEPLVTLADMDLFLRRRGL